MNIKCGVVCAMGAVVMMLFVAAVCCVHLEEKKILMNMYDEANKAKTYEKEKKENG